MLRWRCAQRGIWTTVAAQEDEVVVKKEVVSISGVTRKKKTPTSWLAWGSWHGATHTKQVVPNYELRPSLQLRAPLQYPPTSEALPLVAPPGCRDPLRLLQPAGTGIQSRLHFAVSPRIACRTHGQGTTCCFTVVDKPDDDGDHNTPPREGQPGIRCNFHDQVRTRCVGQANMPFYQAKVGPSTSPEQHRERCLKVSRTRSANVVETQHS